MSRQIVLVSGAPGTGKTTLAVPLSGELGFPLLSKDDIKETLWDALDLPASDLSWSPTVAIHRYERRAHERHPTHVLQVLTPDHLTEFDGPMRVGPVIEVNTEEAVDISSVACRARELLT